MLRQWTKHRWSQPHEGLRLVGDRADIGDSVVYLQHAEYHKRVSCEETELVAVHENWR